MVGVVDEVEEVEEVGVVVGIMVITIQLEEDGMEVIGDIEDLLW